MNSEKFRELERRIGNCVFLNVSDWLGFAIDVMGHGHVLDSCPIDVEEIPSSLPCEDCKGTGYEIIDYDEDGAAEKSGRKPWNDAWEWAETHDGKDVVVISGEICNQCDDGFVDVDILEWWHIDRWLASKLSERDEVVLEGEIWGRQCSGQAIALDSVMGDIFGIDYS